MTIVMTHLLIEFSRSQIVVHHSWFQARVTHGPHEPTALRLKLLCEWNTLL